MEQVISKLQSAAGAMGAYDFNTWALLGCAVVLGVAWYYCRKYWPA